MVNVYVASTIAITADVAKHQMPWMTTVAHNCSFIDFEQSALSAISNLVTVDAIWLLQSLVLNQV